MSLFPEPASNLHQIFAFTVLPLMLTIVFYSLYWVVKSSRKIKGMIYSRYDPTSANVIHVIVKRTAGFVLLGVVPVALTVLLNDEFSLEKVGLGFRTEAAGFSGISLILMSVLIIPVVSFSARKPSVYHNYPEIRVPNWSGGFLFAELFTWGLYLLGYEALFRGVLLFGLAHSLGPVAATIISVILYSAAHLPKNRTETLAAIPFGLALCLLTLYSGSIWIAFFAHLINAVTTTLTAIRFNPSMSFALSGDINSGV